MSDLCDECRVVRAGSELDGTTAPAFARDRGTESGPWQNRAP
ncbi:hypothetical protein ACIGDI_02040 [Streptomyces sp. NPDC085900]